MKGTENAYEGENRSLHMKNVSATASVISQTT